MKKIIICLLINMFFVNSVKAEGVFYYGCQYLYLEFNEESIHVSGNNGYAYFELQRIKREKLLDRYRKEYTGEKLCEDFFKKFDALYSKKEFYENLKKASEIKEESSKIYSKISKLEDKKKKYDPKYDYKKLNSKLEFFNAKLRKLNVQVPNITKYKEYQDIFEYLEKTKPEMDRLHPEWGEQYRQEIQEEEERAKQGYL